MAWAKMKLGDAVTLKRGYDLPLNQQRPGPFPIVTSSGIAAYHEEFKTKGPGVVTGRTGTLGEVFYIQSDFWPHNTALYVKDFKGNNPRFIYYLLQTLGFNLRSAAAAVPTVNRNYLHLLPIRLPPLEIQEIIGRLLFLFDALIEDNWRCIQLLEEIAKGIYREWFVHFRFPGHEVGEMVDSELGEIPEGWGIGAFTDIVEVLSGGTPRTHIPEYWNGEIPFFTPRDIKGGFYILDTERYITKLGLDKCKSEQFAKDTVFITARGTVGRVVMSAVPMAMSQTSYALRGRNKIGQFFVFYKTLECVEQLKKMTHGAVFDTIITDTFKALRISIPPVSKIHSFCKIISPFQDQILNQIKQTNLLQSIRDTLLPKCVSGKIDVSDLKIEIPTINHKISKYFDQSTLDQYVDGDNGTT